MPMHSVPYSLALWPLLQATGEPVVISSFDFFMFDLDQGAGDFEVTIQREQVCPSHDALHRKAVS